MFYKVNSLKFRYLLSAFGIALVACSVVGLLLYFGSLRELRAVNQDQTSETLRLFAEDLSNQQKQLASVSHRLSVEIYYKQMYFERNPYYEIVLLGELEKFKSYSPIISDFFLIYHGSDSVFLSNKTKTQYDLFADAYGLKPGAARLYEALTAVEEFTILPLNNAASDMIFAFPVYTLGKNYSDGRATVGFFVSERTLKGRLDTLAGGIEGSILLFHGQTRFLTLGPPELTPAENPEIDPLLRQTVTVNRDKSTFHTVRSESDLFRVALYRPAGYSFPNMHRFSTLNLIYVVVAVLFLLASSLFVGYNNYLPIQRLNRLFGGLAVQTAGKNELDNLVLMIDSVLRERENAEINLQQQYLVIKEQILTLLLSGDPRYCRLVSKPFMGIYLPGPLFYVAAIRPGLSLEKDQEHRLFAMAEELAEDGMHLYLVNNEHAGVYAAIISALDESMGQDAAEYIKSLWEGHMACTLGVSPPCRNLTELQDAFSLALLDCSAKGPRPDGRRDASDPLGVNDELLDRMLSAMQIGNYRDAGKLFRLFAERTRDGAGSFLYERLILHNALYRVGVFAKTRGVALPSRLLGPVVQAVNNEELVARFEAVIAFLGEAADAPDAEAEEADEKSASRADTIVSYLKQHYPDADMCLELLSERFGLNGRYISNLIKDKTGLSYKDLLISLRIKRAQELLLTENLTVTEVCERVGYTHLPHFIKTFKQITGYTPSNYSQRMRE